MARNVKRINLALQGGGAHGAFTWGALDRLLEDDGIEISGITGTSAGALNGAVLKAGLVGGGRDGAREALNDLWTRVGAVEDKFLSQWMAWIATGPLARSIEYSPAYFLADAWARMVSPYASGPFYANPLKPIVESFEFDKICHTDGPPLFICATRVRSGKIRIFSGDELSGDAILASACLPTMFRAVEIEDPVTGEIEAYWDGGYTGNPALFPLFNTNLPDDVLIVNINPLERDQIPRSPQQIQNRINEISFNSSLLRELRAINFVQRLLDHGDLPPGRMSRVLVHMIDDDELMNALSVATKLMPNPLVLNRLKEAGRGAMDRFLGAHRDDLGKRSTVDLAAMYS